MSWLSEMKAKVDTIEKEKMHAAIWKALDEMLKSGCEFEGADSEVESDGAGEWEEMAEEERMKMVAIKRNKMVRIAQQVKCHSREICLS